MRGIRVVDGEKIVESMLGTRIDCWRGIWDVYTEAPEFWSADGDEQRSDGFSVLTQIAESGFDQIAGG